MRLVQDESDNTHKDEGNLKIENVTIVWSKDIDQIIDTYGKIIIDYITSIFGGKFIIRFSGGHAC